MQASNIEIAGQVVGGEIGSILVRQKSGQDIELGDLLVADSDSDGNFLLLKVIDLLYGSQIPDNIRQLAAGLKLEGYSENIDFMDPKLRNYVVAVIKPIARISKNSDEVKIPKSMPAFFSNVRFASKDDLSFLSVPENPVYLGKVRSGAKVLDVDVYLNGEDLFTHHILIPATTGRGKSNLLKVILWNLLQEGRIGVLVLDPHDEYYGRDGQGLKSHPDSKKNLVYYTSNAPVGANTLVVNLEALAPEHFEGIVSFTDAQQDAISEYHREYQTNWIEQIVLGTPMEGVASGTLRVLQRKMRTSLGIRARDGRLVCDTEVFSTKAGKSTIESIVKSLEAGKVVIIDTSRLSDDSELLIGSIIANEVLDAHKELKAIGELSKQPPVSIVIEEAPRVLSIESMEQASNIYSTIAREGRKFKVGLVAVTQLTSIIPRMVLTNMNTKIILGNEMVTERQAIVDSAAQDLSEEDKTIASLDKGEALVSSIFTKFAIPIYTPKFESFLAKKVVKDEFELDSAPVVPK
jgi:DNA helicase HerA-like ATPase